MGDAARTPEELEDLLEDAFVVQDEEALGSLFEEAGLLITGGTPEVRGAANIEGSSPALWGRIGTYVADILHVVQAADTALVISRGSISVMRRDADRRWRYQIAVLRGEKR